MHAVYLFSRIKFMCFFIFLIFLSSLSHFTFDQGNRRWLLCKRDVCRIGETVSFFNFFCLPRATWRQVCRHGFFPIGLIITIDNLLVAITSNKIPNCLSAITINFNWLLFVTLKAFFLFLWLVCQEKQFSCFLLVFSSSQLVPRTRTLCNSPGSERRARRWGKCPSTDNLLHTFAPNQKLLKRFVIGPQSQHFWTNKNENHRAKELLYEFFAFTGALWWDWSRLPNVVSVT